MYPVYNKTGCKSIFGKAATNNSLTVFLTCLVISKFLKISTGAVLSGSLNFLNKFTKLHLTGQNPLALLQNPPALGYMSQLFCMPIYRQGGPTQCFSQKILFEGQSGP